MLKEHISPPGSHGNRAYVSSVNAILQSKLNGGIAALDLFCGAGGLSLGFKAQGFDVIGYEADCTSADAYSANIGPVERGTLTVSSVFREASVLLAGPPCQPWSRAGGQRGQEDPREGLPIVIAAVKMSRPSAVVVENVPEAARALGRTYLDDFIQDMSALDYVIHERVLDAATFGVPQRRRRLFIVAFKEGTGAFEWPASMAGAVTVGMAIGQLVRFDSSRHRDVTDGMLVYIEKYERASKCKRPRDLYFDEPSRTLTVRNLSGATGDMLRILRSDGTRRRLTVREAARLQSFPDWFTFKGRENQQFEQIGNAVPPILAYHIAGAVKKTLENTC